MEIIIVAPSLDPKDNVSGISSVTQFIIDNNSQNHYIHFTQGKKDNEKKGPFRVISIIKNFYLWIKILSEYPEALIHYNFPLSKASIIRDSIFIVYAYFKTHRIVIHLHGGNYLTSQSIPIYLNKILKYIFSLKIPFIVLSKSEKNIIQKKYKCENIYILPNCIDQKDSNNFLRSINKNNILTIGYLGRITKDKGMDYLLAACIQMKKEGIPFLLKIAGKEESPNEYIPKFYKALGTQFVYNNIVYGDTKNKFLKSLDIFILPSFFEGLPMSLIESMSFGVVPITTNVGSIKDIIENKENGFFIKDHDIKSIVEKIKMLNEDRLLLYRISQNAKSYIQKNLSPKNYINQLNAIYTCTHEN